MTFITHHWEILLILLYQMIFLKRLSLDSRMRSLCCFKSYSYNSKMDSGISALWLNSILLLFFSFFFSRFLSRAYTYGIYIHARARNTFVYCCIISTRFRGRVSEVITMTLISNKLLSSKRAESSLSASSFPGDKH